MLEPQIIFTGGEYSSFRNKGFTSGLQTCGRLIWPEKLNCSTLRVCFMCKQHRLDSALSLNSQQMTQRFIGFTLSTSCQSKPVFSILGMSSIFPRNKIMSSALYNSLRMGKFIRHTEEHMNKSLISQFWHNKVRVIKKLVTCGPNVQLQH